MKPKKSTIAGSIFKENGSGFTFHKNIHKRNFQYPDNIFQQKEPYLVIPGGTMQEYKDDVYMLPNQEYESIFIFHGFYVGNGSAGAMLFSDLLDATVCITSYEFGKVIRRLDLQGGTFTMNFRPSYTGGNFFVEMV